MATEQTSEQRPLGGRSAVWTLFSEKAKIRDKELLKDWENNIQSLLLFAAIFASVLVSLCVETRGLLEQDPLDVIQKTIVYMAERERNASTPLPDLSFTPDHWAVAVNAYFFASLTASIIAAVGAVMSLQWVGEYDAGLDTASTPEQRALRVHYRYRAVKQWYMHQLIAALPIMLYISLALFFVGLIVWFQHFYPSLAFIPLVGLLVGSVGYLITAALTVFYPSAPFRTSMSKLLFRVTWLLRFYTWYAIQIMRLLRIPFFKFISSTWKEVRESDWRSIPKRISQTYKENFDVARARFTRELKVKRIQGYPWMRPERNFWHSIQSRVWEHYNVTRDRTLHLSALSWLANQIHLSAHSQDEFWKLLKELNDIEDFRLREWPQHDRDAPWGYIFSIVLATATATTTTRATSRNETALSDPTIHRLNSPDSISPRKVPDRNLSLSLTSTEIIYASPTTAIMAKAGEEYPPAAPPNSIKLEKAINVIAQLLRKMSVHPEVFERTLSGMTPAVVVAFMDDLASHPPYDAQQAKRRLKSLTVLFSSRRWERLDARTQAGSSTFKVILRCLQRMEASPNDTFISWLFTLCSVDPDTHRVPWPNPEGVGMLLHAFEHQDLRRRAVQYYIDYVDCILTGRELPSTENRRWRWHGMKEKEKEKEEKEKEKEKEKPSEECQIAMLQILAEHLMRILNRESIRQICAEYATSAHSPALRLIMEAYQDDRIPSGNHASEQPPTESYDGPSTYALAFKLGLRVRGSDIARRRRQLVLHQDATQVLLAMVKANTPTMNEMLEELITQNIRYMTADHWIAILEALSVPERKSSLGEYISWMIELGPDEWLKVFRNFFNQSSSSGHHPLILLLTSTLADNLPHKLAQRRWSMAVERLSIAQPGAISELTRVVTVAWKRRGESALKLGPLVPSPLPALLDRMIWDLRNIETTDSASQLPIYLHIIEVLLSGFIAAKSVDQTFAQRFMEVRRQFKRIQPLVRPLGELPPDGAPDIDFAAVNELFDRMPVFDAAAATTRTLRESLGPTVQSLTPAPRKSTAQSGPEAV